MRENSNEDLINSLIIERYLKTPVIIAAFRKIDRQDFVRSEDKELAYINESAPIGFGQTISQPLTVAFMLELLQPQAGDKILDIGSGSAWTTALLAFLVGEQGQVLGLERIPELVKFGQENLAKYHFRNTKILPAGEQLGFSDAAPFDKILVSAAGQEIPEEFTGQLKIGGRLVMPVYNSIWKVDKISEADIKKEEYFGFSFVPLVNINAKK